ncbi:[NiFe]-hydrogenase assembly chaperone HybE [Thermochromatium tepidum]|jgi:hypothetical protein|uniref:[NiFe]-hydrogenase assembly chaperone HybE n=1 Tax=Thermochromatium tepidum ATCC 43061 TaxID=316276 RepID=A0A6I6DZW3_THETI|nr:[NiFe]-hydrogenase assembly chaperone HybE [Thermochromatium tepidum]QGU33144.1 [NiFe]-hydrogenase assembly chaperone HybE [Thermochromatium tepidum ATCC 43061]
MTPEAGWCLCPEGLAEDQALIAAVIAVHERLLTETLAGDPMLNLALPIEVRALRRVEDWRVLLLLTPWMLARLFFPDRVPALALPEGWSAAERANAEYLVLGPCLRFELFGQSQQAHLGYQEPLGHYLLQPLCLNMEPYRDADAVFEHWGEVIRVRDANMEAARRDCPMQKEISRRELFRRLRPGD